MKRHEQAVFRFGEFLLMPGERLLLRSGQAVQIAGKAFDLLVALVQHAGHLMSKDRLLELVWPGLVVEEVNLSVNISVIRKILGAEAARWIETVPRQGYRFNAPVEVADVATLAPTGSRADAQSTSLARLPTADVEAYQAYLQGRYLWNQRSEASLIRAAEHFRGAIQRDPGFALAYAALADTHTTLGYLGYVPPVSTFPVARRYALEALTLDPSLAQAHAALAYIKFYFDWDWEGARQEFRRALDLDPGDPVSHQWHAVFSLATGQPGEAYAEIQTAHRLDPLSLAINTDIGFHHYYNGRYAEAIAQLQSVLGMKSDFLLAHLWLARSYLQVGRFEDALSETREAENAAHEWPVLVSARGFTYGAAGRKGEAAAVLHEMELLSKQRFVTAYGMALVYAGLDRKDEAFAWLDKAFAERSHWLVWLRLDPRWKNLRDDPRFAALVEQMKYPS